MLVLSRKNDQAVVIGGPDDSRGFVKVTVIKIVGASVRLGFEASKDVPVYREEVRERIVADPAREPPIGLAKPTESSGADGNAHVLSGTGNGRSRQPSGERVPRKVETRRALKPSQQSPRF